MEKPLGMLPSPAYERNLQKYSSGKSDDIMLVIPIASNDDDAWHKMNKHK